MANETGDRTEGETGACPPGFFRASYVVFSCLGGQGRAHFYHMPGQTMMIQVPQGVEDLTVHVELNESSAGVNVDLELYDAGPDKFLVSHRDGIVNDEQTEGQFGNLALLYSGTAAGEWLEVRGRFPSDMLLLMRCQSGPPGFSETVLKYSYGDISPCPEVPPGCEAFNDTEATRDVAAWRAWALGRFGLEENSSDAAWEELVAPTADETGTLPWSRFQSFWNHWPEETPWKPAAHLIDADGDARMSRAEFQAAYGIPGPEAPVRPPGTRMAHELESWSFWLIVVAGVATGIALLVILFRLHLCTRTGPSYSPLPGCESEEEASEGSATASSEAVERSMDAPGEEGVSLQQPLRANSASSAPEATVSVRSRSKQHEHQWISELELLPLPAAFAPQVQWSFEQRPAGEAGQPRSSQPRSLRQVLDQGFQTGNAGSQTPLYPPGSFGAMLSHTAEYSR
ncbi:SAMS2 [Symbiodinium natans]|uniref:SAMS2 protein n=1 Tax=Symbiodinium natans TaxID=878477 RepID=A0A812PRU5_9DINO|nr:SAMS2 [Symbiodinium natans]